MYIMVEIMHHVIIVMGWVDSIVHKITIYRKSFLELYNIGYFP